MRFIRRQTWPGRRRAISIPCFEINKKYTFEKKVYLVRGVIFAGLFALCVAIAAIDRPVVPGLKRHFGFFAAGSADRGIHFSAAKSRPG
jgi:hypothetical protein